MTGFQVNQGKEGKMQYIIKSVPSDNPKSLEDLLNEMSQAGWDLYSMHEVETDDGFQYNCIFCGDKSIEEKIEDEEVVNIKTFRSQMEKMLSSSVSPYESCKELQSKIKEQRKKITKIKSQLEAQEDAPISKNRKHLNEEISKGLKELDDLRQRLLKTISPELMYSKIRQEKLSISLSEEVLALVNPDEGAPLIAETVRIREKLATEMGYVIPRIIFEDDEKLSSYEFSIKVRGLNTINTLVYPGYLMFFEEELNLDKKIKDAIYTIDEITGKKIVWIDEKKTKNYWQHGITSSEFIGRLLEFIVIKHIDELLDYSDVNKYMEIISEENMFLIENIIPDFVSIADLRYLFVNLLREGLSIKDIIYIFEKINDFSDEPSKEDLFDKIRLSLSKYISKNIASEDNIIQAFELSDKTLESFFGELDSEDSVVRVDGLKIEKIVNKIIKKAAKYNVGLNNLIFLAPIEFRHMTFIILSQFLSGIKVIAKEEITNEYTIEIIEEI